MWWWIVLIFIYGLQNCCAYFENGASRIAICSSTSSWRLRAGKRPVPARHFPVATPPSHKINDRIIAERVRLIEPSENPEEGEVMAGIFSVAEALARARQRNLDLVLITEEADPPVCKIVDYGKFQYAIEKKRKMLMKKQQKEEVKEVKLSPEIDDHDYETKVKAAVRFLLDGDKVRVVVDFKGRQMAHTNGGVALLQRFAESIAVHGTPDAEPKLEGRSMSFLVVPKKKSSKKKS